MARKTKKMEEVEAKQREIVFNTVTDMVHDFLYHGRKDDPELSEDLLFALLETQVVTTSDIINTFARELRREVEK